MYLNRFQSQLRLQLYKNTKLQVINLPCLLESSSPMKAGMKLLIVVIAFFAAFACAEDGEGRYIKNKNCNSLCCSSDFCNFKL